MCLLKITEVNFLLCFNKQLTSVNCAEIFYWKRHTTPENLMDLEANKGPMFKPLC